MAAHVIRQLVAPGATVFSLHDADVVADGPWTSAPVTSLPFLFAPLSLPPAVCGSQPSPRPEVVGPFGVPRPGHTVLLFGHMSLRRQAVVDDLRHRGLHVHVTNSTFGDELQELLDRTAVVVAPALYPGAKGGGLGWVGMGAVDWAGRVVCVCVRTCGGRLCGCVPSSLHAFPPLCGRPWQGRPFPALCASHSASIGECAS